MGVGVVLKLCPKIEIHHLRSPLAPQSKKSVSIRVHPCPSVANVSSAFSSAFIRGSFLLSSRALLESGRLTPTSKGNRNESGGLPHADGQTHRLEDLRGQYVVVAFFPKAYTGG